MAEPPEESATPSAAEAAVAGHASEPVRMRPLEAAVAAAVTGHVGSGPPSGGDASGPGRASTGETSSAGG